MNVKYLNLVIVLYWNSEDGKINYFSENRNKRYLLFPPTVCTVDCRYILISFFRIIILFVYSFKVRTPSTGIIPLLGQCNVSLLWKHSNKIPINIMGVVSGDPKNI